MIGRKGLAVNTALLTASSLVMRFVGMLWQLWLVQRIGETGIGLFQLILSVSSLAATFALSGIRFTATRLCSEELGAGRVEGLRPAMRNCFAYAGFFGVAAAVILCLLSEPIGFLWLMDARTVVPLRLLAVGLPFMALSSVGYGYFTATGRVWKAVCIQVGRELITIVITLLLLLNYRRGDLEQACRCITAGATFADALAFAVLFAVYLFDLRHYRTTHAAASETEMTGRMLCIALPLAFASYARSGLSTLQHLLVPKGLRMSGLSAAAALAGYGVIQGMALPVVLFPSCLMLALAELIVPQLTAAQVCGATDEIRSVTSSLLRRCFAFSLGVAVVFASLGDAVGMALYGSEEAGQYIRLFALIAPVMYLDMMTDGCLKGLGEMMFCMAVNIADAAVSALLVWLLLPRRGLSAYIFMICFTELFNFLFSLLRLRKVSGWRMEWSSAAYMLFSALTAGAGARALYKAISAGNSIPALIACSVFAMFIYLALLNARREILRPAGAGGTRAYP